MSEGNLINYISGVCKLPKYITKMGKSSENKYIAKLAEHTMKASLEERITQSQTGGLRTNNLDALFQFLNKKHQESSSAETGTKNKYLVILYGPPASGKTLARKIACHLIKKTFKEDIDINTIFKTFIDTGIDEITYQVETEEGYNVSEALMLNLYKQLNMTAEQYRSIDKDQLIRMIRERIDSIVSSSYAIYKRYRKDMLSELLFYFATYFNKNIFLEVATASTIYIDTIINSLSYYNYIPIVIYPVIKDVNILYDRSIQRGMEIGRFLRCDLDTGIAKSLISCHDNYDEISENTSKMAQFLVCRYDADIDKATYDRFNSNDFSSFDNFIVDIRSKIQEGDKSFMVHMINKRININDFNITCKK